MQFENHQQVENHKIVINNHNLISLKVVMFLVFAGLACVKEYNIRPIIINFDHNETIYNISILILTSIGILTVASFADRLADRKHAANFGKYLRFLIAVTLVLGAIVILLNLIIQFDIQHNWWSYLLYRSIIGIFFGSAVTLLNAAVIIATRETSTGIVEVGHLMIVAIVGWSLMPLLEIVSRMAFMCDNNEYLMCIFWIFAAVILIFSTQMPLSSPELWWITNSNILPLPLTPRLHNRPEIVAFVAALLGALWKVVELNSSFDPFALNLGSLTNVIISGNQRLNFLWEYN